MEERHERYYRLMEDRPEAFNNDGPLQIETDIQEIRGFEQWTGKEIGVVYVSPYHIMVVDLVYNTPGRYFTYERILPRVPRGAVITVPVLDDKYVLLKQYRHALRGYQHVFPRSLAGPGVSAQENAENALNGTIKSMRKIGAVIGDSNLYSNKVTVFECVMEDYEPNTASAEIDGYVELTRDELKNWVKEGKIDDGFTLSTLEMLGI